MAQVFQTVLRIGVENDTGWRISAKKTCYAVKIGYMGSFLLWEQCMRTMKFLVNTAMFFLFHGVMIILHTLSISKFSIFFKCKNT